MDSRVKTLIGYDPDNPADQVSILVLMDSRVKTIEHCETLTFYFEFQSLF